MKTEINQINENLKNIYSYRMPSLEVKMTKDTEELKKAINLRQTYYQSFQPGTFLTQGEQVNKTHSRVQIEQKSVAYDGYDSFSEHLIVVDNKKNKVIAYVRLIDAYTAFKIGGYFSEIQFNLNKLFNHNAYYLEMSRVVIDPEYNCRETAHLLWSALIHYSGAKGIDSLIGTLSLPILEPKETFSFIQNLKDKHISNSEHRVSPFQLYPTGKIEKNNNFSHPLIEYFFEKGSKLCGDAHWNHESNCAEIFIHYPLINQPVFPDHIPMDEVDSGVNYIN